MEEVVKALRKTNLFANVDGNVLEELAGCFRKRKYADGSLLCKEGERQTKGFLISAGCIKRKKNVFKDEEGSEVSLEEIDSVKTESFVGFMHLFNRDPAFASLYTYGETEVWEIEADSLHMLLHNSPAVSTAVISALSREVRSTSRLLRACGITQEVAEKTKIAVFDSKQWVVDCLEEQSNKNPKYQQFKFVHFPERLSICNVSLANGCQAVCCFVNDNLDSKVIKALSEMDIGLIAMRCAGFDRVDLNICQTLGITVARVPAYSPYAVAEHAAALMFTLNRKTHRAYPRTRDGNFSLNGLLGVDFYGKTVGVIGTGKIGVCFINIVLGMGCKVLCFDIYQNKSLLSREGVKYVELDELLQKSDFVSLHVPLTTSNKHMINAKSLAKMKKGVMIINTSRGGLIDTEALIEALASGQVGAAGLDVYEEEADYFHEDCSEEAIADPTLGRLLSFNNVILTSHQAFFTKEAVDAIASTTLENILLWKEGVRGHKHPNAVFPEGNQ